MQKRIGNRVNDPLRLLAFAWSVEAVDEEDAVFRALERATNIPEPVWRSLVEVEPVDAGVFVIHNRKMRSSIMARVTPAPERGPIPFAGVVHGPVLPYRSTTFKEFYVTFYPETYSMSTESE